MIIEQASKLILYNQKLLKKPQLQDEKKIASV